MASNANAFLEAVANRRSMYNLAKESTIPNTRILDIVKQTLTHAPSPFNVRSARAIVLFGDDHTKLWQAAYRITEQQSPAAIGILGPKIKGLEAAYGTVMFFDDSAAFDLLTPRFAGVSKQYPEWEEHSAGMHQFIAWTALEAEGLGCSLQHYQPSITGFLGDEWNVPASWTPKCQLVFGKPLGERPEAKAKTHLESALLVYGA